MLAVGQDLTLPESVPVKTRSESKHRGAGDADADVRDDVEEDGRRQRSSRSRERIVHAMIELIRAGEMSPAAARVAEKANVGLRTVFRHFEEMETLTREISGVTFSADQAEGLTTEDQRFTACMAALPETTP